MSKTESIRIPSSFYLVSGDAGEMCMHLYLAIPKTVAIPKIVAADGEATELDAEIVGTLRRGLASAGLDGSTRIRLQATPLEHGRAAEAILREHAPAFGKEFNRFKTGKTPELKLLWTVRASDPGSVALMALHRRVTLQ